MAAYAVEFNRTASTTLSLGTVGADATRPRRGRWFMGMFSCEGASADNVFKYVVQWCSALGTSTGVTPTPLDPADAATESDAGENHTVDATYIAGRVVLAFALNQRAIFQWHAAPGGELVYPATAANGLGISTPTAAALAITATVHYREE